MLAVLMLLPSSPSPAVSQLIGTLHVANVDADLGTLPMPSAAKVLLVEISRSVANGTLSAGGHKDAYVVSFQPMLPRYAQMLQQGRSAAHDRFQGLGEHLPGGKGIVLPFAVGARPGLQNLSVSDISGCYLPGRSCVGADGPWAVETITLAEALRLTGSLPIAVLRLDVCSLAPLRAASALDLRRVREISLGLQCRRSQATCTPAARCLSDAAPLLQRFGFQGECAASEVHAQGRLAVFSFKRVQADAVSPIVASAISGPAPPTPALRPLFARVQLAELVGGRISRLHDGGEPPKQVIIEIGCSDFETMDERFSANRANEAAMLLLSFEPLVDKWATLLARGRKRFSLLDPFDLWPLGRHLQNGVVLPFAGASEAGLRNISVSSTAGCSSLAPFNPDYKTKRQVGRNCVSVREKRVVQTVTLDDAVGLVPMHARIHLKVDAQGLDTSLITATSPATLARVDLVSMEVRSDECPVLYAGQPKCSTTTKEMDRIGLVNTNRCEDVGRMNRNYACEAQISTFKRKGSA